ncbi:hypothetical protein B0H10DRAFT_547873 [Mycena sp. CBHHK59/15]|nr:hypothetical protein B0H10DRAFT_547873 [Mycena sp. CBHHK59/15]
MLTAAMSRTEPRTMSESSPITMPTIAAQRAAIQQEIEWHYNQISMLKAKSNALAPIYRLPNEIISLIFAKYAVETGQLFNLRWTKVMLVCRRWHDVALGAQPLWGFIEAAFHRGLKRLMIQLQRSGAAPLTVKIVSYDTHMYSSMLLEHAERLRDLDFSGNAPHILAFLNQLSEHRFPLLYSIKLEPNYKWDEVPADLATTFPNAIFDGRAPRLETVELSSLSVRWDLLRGLQGLSLMQSLDTDPSFGTLLSVLQACPGLRDLKLGSVLFPMDPLESYPVVSLPLLECIWLHDDVERCTEILRHVAIPAAARVCVYGLGIRTGRDVMDILIPLRKHVRAPSAPTLRCIQLDCTEGSRTNFMVSAFTQTSAPSVLDTNAAFMINTHPTNEHTLRQIMTKTLKALPCHTITHLDTRLATHLTATSWRGALALLPALEMAYMFVNNGAVKFLQALCEDLESPKGTVGPRLRHLHMYAYVWKRNTDAPDVVPPVLDALRQLLILLHARGTPLEVLEVDEQQGCLGMDESEWEALFGLVGKFIRNDRVYNPIQRRREYEEMELEWKRVNETAEAAE